MRRRRLVRSARLLAVGSIVVVGIAVTVEPRPHDAAYWIARMEAALLPQPSLRTEASVVTRTRLGREEKGRLNIVRVQGPERLRTLLTIEGEDEPLRSERVEFEDNPLHRSVFFPNSGMPFRTPRFSSFEKQRPYTRPTRAVVENQRSGRTSTLSLSSTFIGFPVLESEFGDVHIQERLEVLEDATHHEEPF